jgi:lysophospholipase L1-like esterase
MNIFIYPIMSLKALWITLLALITAGSAFSQEKHQVRMAMVGNSITYGAGLPDPSLDCYPTQLDSMLRGIYGDTVLIRNYGVSGRTMLRATDYPIWNESAFRNALEFVPDICLILLGTNDSKPERWVQWGDVFFDDYMAMIDTFRFRNPNTQFILCYPPPIWEGHPYGTTYDNSHNDSVVVNHLIPLIDSVADAIGALRIDFHTPFVDSLQYFPDKLHPDVEGSRIMAEILYDSLVQTDLIHQVETGLAFVSRFRQSPSLVQEGRNVTLSWNTIFADSVWLDAMPVDSNGSLQVVAALDQVYTLTAKGSNNRSEYQLSLNVEAAPTATPDPQGSQRVRVYPNPVKDVLYFEVKNLPARSLDLKVFNSQGQQVLSQTYPHAMAGASLLELDISRLPTGVYSYFLSAGNEKEAGKFTKHDE